MPIGTALARAGLFLRPLFHEAQQGRGREACDADVAETRVVYALAVPPNEQADE